MKILCIDDSKAIHAFLKECVREVATEFHSVFDGEQGVHLLTKSGAPVFDLIFLDWEMPKKIGPDVLLEIKKHGVKTPVIMLTTKNDVSDIALVLERGASEYIMKPFTKDIIVEKISEVTGLNKSL